MTTQVIRHEFPVIDRNVSPVAGSVAMDISSPANREAACVLLSQGTSIIAGAVTIIAKITPPPGFVEVYAKWSKKEQAYHSNIGPWVELKWKCGDWVGSARFQAADTRTMKQLLTLLAQAGKELRRKTPKGKQS